MPIQLKLIGNLHRLDYLLLSQILGSFMLGSFWFSIVLSARGISAISIFSGTSCIWLFVVHGSYYGFYYVTRLLYVGYFLSPNLRLSPIRLMAQTKWYFMSFFFFWDNQDLPNTCPMDSWWPVKTRDVGPPLSLHIR